MIKSPVPGLTILAAYLYFINSLGPRLMANRKPFKLEKTLIVYNLIQVIVSCWLVFEALDGAWLRHYSWRCQPVDHSRSPQAFRVSYFDCFMGIQIEYAMHTWYFSGWFCLHVLLHGNFFYRYEDDQGFMLTFGCLSSLYAL